MFADRITVYLSKIQKNYLTIMHSNEIYHLIKSKSQQIFIIVFLQMASAIKEYFSNLYILLIDKDG